MAMSQSNPNVGAPAARASSMPRLNPMANDFTPSARISSKRKASSSAKSSLTQQDASHIQIYINPDQIVGSDSPLSSTALDGVEEWSDLDELEDALVNDRPLTLPRNRMRRNISATYRQSDRDCQGHVPAMLLIRAGSDANPSSDDTGSSAARLPYLPLYQHSSNISKGNTGLFTVLPSHVRRIQQADGGINHASSDPVQWPVEELPVELFDLIVSHLDREDIKSMRLVNTEFERKVCQALFRTAVVPFNTEIYDMVVDEKKATGRGNNRTTGKGKEKVTDADTELWGWRNAKEDKEGKVYLGHGLRVFQGFGPYIRRFGMRFDVVESQLSNPPRKQLLDPVDSYHGTYEWPSINYARFANLNRLEQTADETSRMKSAFSNLAVVTELGLSLRNGLGWLEGPDKSFRARLLQPSTAIFDTSRTARDRKAKSAREMLTCLRQGVQRASTFASFKELTLERRTLNTPLDKILGLEGTGLADWQLWSTLDHEALDASSGSSQPGRFTLLCANSDAAAAARPGDVELNPSDLKKEQKEWLLETEWAQRAFLESYVLAVMDNPNIGSRIRTLNLACVSSGLLPLISRAIFWDALPSVSSVLVHVSPDWRTVQKDDAGYAETKPQNPSEAIRGFHDFLHDLIAERPSIAALNIGWADGGEHAQGLFARNANILPAPVAPLSQSTAINPSSYVVFEHIEHLTLTNCWITPNMLDKLVKSHADLSLKKLTLESVSLTSHPNTPNPAQQVQAAALAMGNFPAHHVQPINPPPGFVHPPAQMAITQQQFLANQFQNNMQQMQQLFNHQGHAFNNVAPPPPVPNVFAGPPANPFNPLWAAQGGLGTPQQHLGFHPPAFPLQPQHHWPPNAAQWTAGHRQGSWPDVLNKISPGSIFADYLPQPQPWEDPRPPRPATNLETIELRSCGYVSLNNNTTFDQSALLAEVGMGRDRALTAWFRARILALKPYMMEGSSDKYLANIAQWIPQHEVDAMRYAWGLRIGWRDHEKAEEAEFDGRRPGGTGRVSGVISKGMPLMGQQRAGLGANAASPAGPSAGHFMM